MRTIILTTLLLAFALGCAAVDIIVKKDGTTLRVYDLDEGTAYISYRTAPRGPLKRVAVGDVFSVKIGNGEMHPVGKKAAAATAPRTRRATPAADNAAIIARYNAPKAFLSRESYEKAYDNLCMTENKKRRVKSGGFITVTTEEEYTERRRQEPGLIAQKGVTFFAVTDTSVLSTDDIRVHLLSDGVQKRVYVENKRDYPIYIDLTSTFEYIVSGKQCLYSRQYCTGAKVQTTQTSGSLGLDFFGFSFMGGETATHHDYTIQPTLALPPHDGRNLPEVKLTAGSSLYTLHDRWRLTDKDTPLALPLATGRLLPVTSDYPWTANYLIAYSRDADFKERLLVPVTVRLAAVYGVPGGTYFSKQLSALCEKDRDYFLFDFHPVE